MNDGTLKITRLRWPASRSQASYAVTTVATVLARADEALGRISHELLRTAFHVPLADIAATLQRDGNWQGELTHDRRDGTVLHVASHWAVDHD